MLTELIVTMCIIGGISIILIIEKVDNIIILNLITITPFIFIFLFIFNKIYTLSIKPFIRSSSSDSLMHPQAYITILHTTSTTSLTSTTSPTSTTSTTSPTSPTSPIFVIDDIY